MGENVGRPEGRREGETVNVARSTNNMPCLRGIYEKQKRAHITFTFTSVLASII